MLEKHLQFQILSIQTLLGAVDKDMDEDDKSHGFRNSVLKDGLTY